MAYILVSAILITGYLFFLVYTLLRDRPLLSGHNAGTAFIRLSVFLLLCMLPALSLSSGLTGRYDLARYAEAAPPVISLSLALVGLIFIAQRYLAQAFGMRPGFDGLESGFLVILAASMYGGYMFGTFAGLYYLGPGLYAAFLVIRGKAAFSPLTQAPRDGDRP